MPAGTTRRDAEHEQQRQQRQQQQVPDEENPGVVPDHQESCVSLGKFLAGRLVEIGVTHAFAVPGDFNLTLLDELVAKKELQMVWTCNELNAGYAADGFCRHRGVGACVVTYGVGGLSVINATAGCYSEDLPVIFISGGPNSNDFSANHTIHHTIGLPDLAQQYRAFKEVTCAAVVIQHLAEAHHQIDYAISQALKHQKPAYIEICCNLAGLQDHSFTDPPIPFVLPCGHTNQASLKAAVAEAVKALQGSHKPVLLGGPRLRARGRQAAFQQLAEAFQGGVATTADAKSLFPEDHRQYIGHYWGSISSPCTCETVESADLVMAVGCVWTDYSTVGYSLLLKPGKLITVEVDRVTIRGGKTFGCIDCEAFLRALADAVPARPASLTNFKRMLLPPAAPATHPTTAATAPGMLGHGGRQQQGKVTAAATTGSSRSSNEGAAAADRSSEGAGMAGTGSAGAAAASNGASGGENAAIAAGAGAGAGAGGVDDQVAVTEEGRPLTTNALFQQVQGMLSPDTCILAETGDSWFNTLKLKLPAGSDYVMQMRYGSIGWSVGATLGYSLAAAAAAAAGKRLVSFIGDGSFQVTAQDVSTMMRYNANPIIFLINNAGYAIEIEIHDGPYNRIQNWDYVGLVKAMCSHRWGADVGSTADDGSAATAARVEGKQGSKLFAVKVCTEQQLAAAIAAATSEEKSDCLVFIEVIIDTDDVSKELLEFGARVGEANSRKPNPQ